MKWGEAFERALKPLAAGPKTLVLKFAPFGTLSAREGAEIIAHLRNPNDAQQRQELPSAKSLRLSANEVYVLARADQLLSTLDRLERMEKHYHDVAKLDASEVRRRLAASNSEDPGLVPYKRCLTKDGADPRVEIAKRILVLIPIARRHLEAGKPALDLSEIFMLNDRANMLLMEPHLNRGLRILAATSEWGRGRSPQGKKKRQRLALQFLEERKDRPSLTQREFAQSCNPPIDVRTLQRGLEDLEKSPI